MSTKTYWATGPLFEGGRSLDAGDAIELSERGAAFLLAAGRITAERPSPPVSRSTKRVATMTAVTESTERSDA